MSKLTLTKNYDGTIIKRINGVKPLPTISGFLSSEYTLENTPYVACNYYAICGTSGYVVPTISGETDEDRLEEYDLSDRETAIVYCNKILEALDETVKLPFIKSSKLIKRYHKMLDRLEELHSGIAEEILHALEGVEDDVNIEDEETLDYAEKCRQESIHEAQMSFCELAKKSIDDAQNTMEFFVRLNLDEEYSYIEGIQKALAENFNYIRARIKDRFSCDDDAFEAVFSFVGNFIKDYNRMPEFEKINISRQSQM